MTETTITLAPLRQHPELAGMDDATLTLFADTLGIDTIRNWDGALATTIAGAWRIREHLEAEHRRRAEADNARRDQLAAQSAAELAPIHRKLAVQQRRMDALAAIDADRPIDPRYAQWEADASERGDARLAAPALPATEPDTRSPLERLLAKGTR